MVQSRLHSQTHQEKAQRAPQAQTAAAGLAGAARAPRISIGRHYMTIGFALWLVSGIFVDGYAHNHNVPESFFTPWHALLYSGFLASACWMAWLTYESKRKTGLPWLKAIPDGYSVGLIGVAIFLLGGLSDMMWHIIFGIEQDIAALLSPSHLMLLVGGLLILASPFRAAWNDAGLAKPTWRVFTPVLLSVAFTLGIVSFFLMYAWTFRYNLAGLKTTEWYMNQFYSMHIMEVNATRGVTFIILNTIQFMLPVFLLIKRWVLPKGTITALFTALTVMMSVLDGFENFPAIVIGFAAGIVADVLYRLMRPSDQRIGAMRMFALAVPIVLWSFYFLVLELTDRIGWDTELWTGAIVSAALASLALSLLSVPPKMPDTEQHEA
ncbi:hypothetical protein [Paenibacillus sp. MMS18-CY102]|uniref:hypothetical protein n=1 Tax=Paenibacillus sp. MMS18-CY102 TaxID=2682849 RepID=UPI0013664A7E|nr:hypothetical protein [Paenibacillus sp. MMS18-CY102]MWC29424.1 hypothetical protein [Paenibacillus sp. MMS18-CY102]